MGHAGEDDATPPARLTAARAAEVAETLSALTTPSRLLILSELRQGPATVSALTATIGMEQSAVSHQLRLLRHMGMVIGQRHGKSIVYRLFDDHVAALLDEAVYHSEHLRMNLPDSVPAGQ